MPEVHSSSHLALPNPYFTRKNGKLRKTRSFDSSAGLENEDAPWAKGFGMFFLLLHFAKGKIPPLGNDSTKWDHSKYCLASLCFPELCGLGTNRALIWIFLPFSSSFLNHF